MLQDPRADMTKIGDVVNQGCFGSCLYLVFNFVFLGRVVATLNFPCDVIKDMHFPQGYHVNCSYKRLTKVPHDFPAHMTTLLLNNNDISELQHTVFSNVTELMHLDLSSNKLTSNKLAPDTFISLGYLVHLDLSNNSLCMSNECFPPRLYRPLNSLEVLKLTANSESDDKGITEYPFRSLSVLQELTELHVSGIPDIDIPSDIARFKNIQVLDLYKGLLPRISAATFRALNDTNISTLSLRDSQIRIVESGSFSNLPKLRNLNIAHNKYLGFRTIIRAVWATENSGIDSLVIDSVGHGTANSLSFQHVCETSFANQLRRLSLRYNNIVGIDVNYFGKCLPNVEWLNFGYNSLLFVILHDNKRSELFKMLPPRLVTIDLSHYGDTSGGSEITSINRPFEDEFRRPLPQTLNNTTESLRNACSNQSNSQMFITPFIRYIHFDHASVGGGYDIGQFTLHPENCVLYMNLSYSKSVRSLSGPWCGLTHLQILDLSHGSLESISTEYFRCFESLRLLNLSHNKLSDMTVNNDGNRTTIVNNLHFNHLTSMEELDLSGNRFRTFSRDSFASLNKLRTLKLNGNLFKSQLSLNLSRLTSLHSLDLSRNQMAFLSKDLRDSLDELSERVNFSLDIGGNPLSCHTCASLGFLRWLQTTHVRVVAKDKLRCTENRNKRVVKVPLEGVQALCTTATSGVSLVVVLAVAGIVGLCTMMLLVILYLNRWRMSWYYYSIKRRWWKNERSAENVGYRYDACVVCADDDLQWVAHDLVEQVETDRTLSLFVSLRDAPAGCPIAENIVQSLETSRYVLFVLTPHFCVDKWCDFAVNMALLRDHESLVLLCIRPIMDESISRTIRALLNPRARCTSIQWGDSEHAQSLFWRRLLDTLIPTTDSDMLLYRLAPCTRRSPMHSD